MLGLAISADKDKRVLPQDMLDMTCAHKTDILSIFSLVAGSRSNTNSHLHLTVEETPKQVLTQLLVHTLAKV